MTVPHDPNSERILVLAPYGRDARLIASVMAEAGVPTLGLADLSALQRGLSEGAGAVLIAEEAVLRADLAPLHAWLKAQAPWSGMPFIVLVHQGGGPERNPMAARLSDVLGNVSFVERPFHPTTLISLASTALRGRRRQYEARARLEELREGAEQLRELNATLEERIVQEVAERARTEEQLRQSQKLEAVGQLTGGVAHDFNNLLTIIRSSVDFLRRRDLPEARRQRYIEAVSDTVDRAAKLTGQLLAFARRQTLKPEVFEVGTVLRGVSDMLDTVTGAPITVTVDVPDERCYVRADLSQFETALVNMAVNARDAMSGGGTLTLRLMCGAPMPAIRGHAGSLSGFAAVSITDTGSGIDAEALAHIFEPFFTTKEVGKGTGLGLSQVFGFAKQSGGDVEVTSALGQGTTFTLYLPEVEGAPEVAGHELDEVAAAPRGAGRRVLVVEDNLEVGHFAKQTLEDLGYVTAWAKNAEEALHVLEGDDTAFDVVFSDVVMPGMGGLALAEALRRSHPELPVILASGYSHVLAQEGAHGFELLHKPYSVDQLSRVLRQVTRRRPRGRTAAAKRLHTQP